MTKNTLEFNFYRLKHLNVIFIRNINNMSQRFLSIEKVYENFSLKSSYKF